MIKELLYTAYQQGVEQVHIGVFPAQGRYFIREMQLRAPGIFHVEVDLPIGKSYYQFFTNGNFGQVEEGGAISPRIPLLLESELFCPVAFAEEHRYISYQGNGVWELRALTYQGWIEKVHWVDRHQTRSFERIFSLKNKNYWSLTFEGGAEALEGILLVEGNSQARYLHRGYNFAEKPDFEQAFRYHPAARRKFSENLPPAAVGYQIFPDSFSLSPLHTSPVPFNYWGSRPKPRTHFGGNFLGILEKLPYLVHLGIDFIYLNPVFQATNAHRYDCTDFRRIDPILGTEEHFEQLLTEAHRLGLRVVLDVSLNHVGTAFGPFQDVLAKQQQSPYVDWFIIRRFPVSTADGETYESWGQHSEMPLLNLENPGLRAYLLDSLRYWTSRYNIDGWRLDVSTEVPVDFVDEIAAALDEIRDGCLLIGECWYHRNASALLDSGNLNGITNFTLYWDILHPFFLERSMSMERLAEKLLNMVWSDTWLTLAQSWNFLGNHDTARFFSLLGEKELYRPAMALLYALPGSVVLYYGEEVCMEGMVDPDNRATMNWKEAEEETGLIPWVRRLNDLRRQFRSLFHYGQMRLKMAGPDNQILVLERRLADQSLLFVFNFSDQFQLVPEVQEMEQKTVKGDLLSPENPFSTSAGLLPFSVRIYHLS